MPLQTGDTAPDFALVDQFGEMHRLEDYRGKPVVLYFYPKDDTPGCTKEACSFRDGYGQFRQQGAVVLGVSPDSSKSHGKFAAKYNLPFTLLADQDHQLAEQYGVWGKKKKFGREYDGILRTTFIIGPDGKIARVFENVKPEDHSLEVLSALKNV